jgi:hypothetical protein
MKVTNSLNVALKKKQGFFNVIDNGEMDFFSLENIDE